jgi:hypothetical protein
MSKRLMMTTMAALFLMSSAAFAATAPTAQECATLQQQFDQAIVQHATAPKASQAKNLYTEAGKLCKAGKYKSGVAKYNAAFKDIGVTPKM